MASTILRFAGYFARLKLTGYHFAMDRLSKNILIFFIIFFVVGIGIVWRSLYSGGSQYSQESSFANISPEGVKKPSEVLAQKETYSGQELVIRGKVSELEIVCNKMQCQPGDYCCGCPEDRDLVIRDSGSMTFSQNPQSILKLKTADEDSFCHRKPGSCEYNCGEFKIGQIYDVRGMLVNERAPSGLNISLNLYFLTSDYGWVAESQGGFWNELIALFNTVKGKIANLGSSGSYVLQN